MIVTLTFPPFLNQLAMIYLHSLLIYANCFVPFLPPYGACTSSLVLELYRLLYFLPSRYLSLLLSRKKASFFHRIRKWKSVIGQIR